MKKLLLVLLSAFLFAFVPEVQAIKNVQCADGYALVGDDVVLHTQGGKPILPDLEKRRGGKAPAVPNEITFTFDSLDYPWSAEELETLRQWVANFSPVLKKICGDPAFAITVNVSKDPTIYYDGLYYPSSNEIVMRSLNVDVFVHESIHAFRDDLIMYANMYEEGMTRATELAAFALLPQYSHWDAHHSYGIDVFYEMNNQPGIAALNGNFWSGFVNPLMRYQQAGYGWGKPYLEDQNFFVKFNAKYYALALADPSIQGDAARLTGIAASVKKTVEKQKFSVWYAGQQIFNVNPEAGYQTIFKGDSNTFYVFYREEYGSEFPIAGANVSWQLSSCQGTYLGSGSIVTGDYGWVEIPVRQLVYKGKVLIKATVELPGGGTVEKSITTTNTGWEGIFGITSVCEGTVQAGGKSATITNGAFSIPELESVAGTFTVQQGKVKKVVTKDASDYFVSVP